MRMRIYDHVYWKEHCFALSAEALVDKAMDLQYVGGTYGGNRSPTPFICLLLKMLQIQPEKDIVIEFIKNEEYKYVRALGAFYMRLVGKSVDVFQYLEPLYNDYRKIRYRSHEGFEIIHMDEFVDRCITDEFLCDIALPSIPKRSVLEDNNVLAQRISVLDDEFQAINEHDMDGDTAAAQLAGSGQEATVSQDGEGEKGATAGAASTADAGAGGDEVAARRHSSSRSPKRDQRRSRSRSRSRSRRKRRSRSHSRGRR